MPATTMGVPEESLRGFEAAWDEFFAAIRRARGRAAREHGDELTLSQYNLVGALTSILSTTSVNVALSTLSFELDAPIDQIQWVVTAYLLALAAVIPVTGWAVDRFGVRRLWLTTSTIFVGASALCGLAWSANSLIAFRVIQGLAGGMIMPLGIIILTLAVGPARVGRAMSVVGVPMLLGPTFGPVLGGDAG